jgi:hypothetical protein
MDIIWIMYRSTNSRPGLFAGVIPRTIFASLPPPTSAMIDESTLSSLADDDAGRGAGEGGTAM